MGLLFRSWECTCTGVAWQCLGYSQPPAPAPCPAPCARSAAAAAPSLSGCVQVPGEVPRDGVRQYDPGDFGDMLDWTATDTEQQSTGKAKPKKKTKKKRDLKRDEARNEAWWHGPGGLPHDREL